MYLINNKRIKYKVWIERNSSGHWQLYSHEWKTFVKKSGYSNIDLFHFIHESADTYYVTGYDSKGVESGGYRNPNSELGSSRWLGFAGNDPTQSPVSVEYLNLLIIMSFFIYC